MLAAGEQARRFRPLRTDPYSCFEIVRIGRESRGKGRGQGFAISDFVDRWRLQGSNN
jgi:hypothetical protein